MIELLGGPASVALILGLKSPRYVADVASGARKMPEAWIPILKKALEKRRDEINEAL